uniref:Ig-like domain-containing protein n=1 Tax=Poecilia mexicana TaxID=48701 RepID=A0A3B3WU17_9TELE
QPNEPYIGETITLTCEVQGGEITEWTCEWRRDGSFIHRTYNKDWTFRVSESSSGDYMCQCRNRDDWFSLTRLSEVIVSRHPNWSQMFSGETITLTCEVQGGETTEWKCEWSRDGSVIHWTSKDWTFKALPSSSGDYICHCRRRDDWYSPTMWWSKAIKLSVALERPTATLATGPTTIPVGGSVTLSCSVEPSAGWKYRCCTFNHFIDTVQLYIFLEHCFGETITLTCEVQGGETTEWTCEWRRPGLATHRANGKDWTLRLSDSSSGDYMCRCRRRDDWHSSTKWSEAITLSVSGSTTIPVGGSVTLSCSVKPSAGWKYRWFRQTSDTPEDLDNEENRNITVTQGGIYRCYGVRGNPSFYTEPSDVTIQISCKFHHLIDLS